MPNTLSKEKLHNLNEIITPVSLVFLKKIGEYKGKQILYSNQQQEHLDKLQMNALIDNTLASNNIDNINIKYNEFMCLFEGMKEPDNNIESETIRYLKVLNLINSHFDSVELSSDLVLQFQKNPITTVHPVFLLYLYLLKKHQQKLKTCASHITA